MVYLRGPPRRVAPGGSFDQNSYPLRRRSVWVDRKIGYGDLDDWNALPAADQNRIRSHSAKLLSTFKNTKWFLQALASFPFKTKQLEDGSYTFQMHKCGWVYVLFLFKSIIMAVVFVTYSLGIFSIFIAAEFGRALHDRCGNTWGKNVMSRNMPAVIFVWSQLMLTTAGDIYMIIHGNSFLSFYNVVNEAVMQLDVDTTTGMRAWDIRASFVFGSLFVICTSVFFSGKLHSLEEISVFVIQAITHFFIRDLYTVGASKNFTATDYEDLLPKCRGVCRGCYGSSANIEECRENECYNVTNDPSIQFKLIKWIGFFIIVFSMLSARAFIRQFEFFCQVLVNLTSVWNKRFLNYASKDNTINMEDPYRRRISNQYMLKDHYEIVRLYNETESNFSFLLFMYYTSVFFNLICQFYYTALLSTQKTCASAVQRERNAAAADLCYANSTLGINNNKEVLEAGLVGKSVTGVNIADSIVSFEDACAIRQEEIIQHASITTTVLLLVTLSAFVITTVDADRASHQADIGFYRVRKRGYMTCRTREDRNAMHSLVFSFTGPKPFCITAAGYFPIKKKTIVVLTSVAFIYFLIILGFKPGVTKALVRCYTLTSSGNQRWVIQYPKVI